MKKFRYFISIFTYWVFGIVVASNKEEANEFLIELEDGPQMG